MCRSAPTGGRAVGDDESRDSLAHTVPHYQDTVNRLLFPSEHHLFSIAQAPYWPMWCGGVASLAALIRRRGRSERVANAELHRSHRRGFRWNQEVPVIAVPDR